MSSMNIWLQYSIQIICESEILCCTAGGQTLQIKTELHNTLEITSVTYGLKHISPLT